LYYPELWDDLRSYLSCVENGFDFFVTIPEEVEISEAVIAHSFPDVWTYRCPNRGRDIAPFLRVFSDLAPLNYKYVCKIHSKKSPHLVDGAVWRTDKLGKLLGSVRTVEQVKAAFDSNPDWGLIAPQGHVLPLTPDGYYWGGNAERVFELAHVAGIARNDVSRLEFSFAAGSMFWFRPEALRRLGDLPLNAEDFEAEAGQVDRTLAHAVERLVGLIVAQAGFRIAEVDSRDVRLPDIPFQFRQLMRQSQELKNRVERLNQELEEKDTALQGLYSQIRDLTVELATTRHHVEALLSSASWRWTAPLRATWRSVMGDKP
jgi:lipopolysaccharide biosynthesis protein